MSAITPNDQSDADDLLQRVAELLESANSYLKEERSADANSLVAKAKQLAAGDPNASAMVDLYCATTFLEQGNTEQGLHALTSMLAEYGEWLETAEGRDMYEFIQVQRAFSLRHLGKNLEARPLLEQAAQFELDCEVIGDVYCHLASCYHELFLYTLAKEQFERADSFGVREEWQPTFRHEYGHTLYELKEFQRAKREFILCLQSGPSGPSDRATALQWLAATCRKLGEYSEARGYEDRARSLKP